MASDDTHEARVALIPSSDERSTAGFALLEAAREYLRDHLVAFSVSAGNGAASVSTSGSFDSGHRTTLFASVETR